VFNIGAIAGAVVGSLALSSGASWRWLWPGVGAVAIVLSLTSLRSPPGSILDAAHSPHSPTLAPVGESAPAAAHLDRSLRSDGLVVFLFVFALAEVTEGGAFTWGVLYLRHHLHAGILVGAAAYVVGHVVAALSRSLGGGMLRSTPVATAFVIGSLITAGGLSLEAATPVAVTAAIGLTLATAGTSLIWPLAMSTVASRASRPGQAVGTFTAAGYVGWVAGAPVVGLVSDRWGPAAGLYLMAALCVVVVAATLAGAVPAPGSNRPVPVT
jgi:predicted MFS family arabinose efflux permease